MALDELAAGWLRDEHRIYSAVSGSFMPQLLGWHDEERTLLLLEDLADAFWPPPWTAERIEAVLSTLHEVAGTATPP